MLRAVALKAESAPIRLAGTTIARPFPQNPKKTSSLFKNMSHNDWRFFDSPLRGSWRHLPDDLSMVRGPTIVILPDGRSLRVPAQMKNDVVAPGDKHDADDGNSILQSFQKMLRGMSGGKRANKQARARASRRHAGGRGPLNPLDPDEGGGAVEAEM